MQLYSNNSIISLDHSNFNIHAATEEVTLNINDNCVVLFYTDLNNKIYKEYNEILSKIFPCIINTYIAKCTDKNIVNKLCLQNNTLTFFKNGKLFQIYTDHPDFEKVLTFCLN